MRAGGPRHQARELALKVLFELESGSEETPRAVLAYHAKEAGVSPATRTFAAELIDGVREHAERLDATIQGYSRSWSLGQMGKVDRIVLRIAIYEISIARNVPVKAAINESILLAQTFASDESGRFVNGILGRVAETA